MPIVDGKYEAKISTTFRSTEEAIKEIKKKIEKSRRVRISNIPMELLGELAPLLKGKDVKMILPMKAKASDELRKLGEVAVQKAKIYRDYKGIDANAGSIYFSDRVFSIAWAKEKILEIDAMDYDNDVGWRYSEK
ncbi:MAG: hypothetical protein ACYS0C_09445 [Planctomycetota bacterium]|jgi:Zn-finger domain-containing protein